jgi:tripartite-type tricarboxylate transporter receptor subunit TctC
MRAFRTMAGLVCLAAAVAGDGAAALDYPTRPVRLIVGYAAGGSGDIVARLISEPLRQRLGGSIVVENRPGAGTNIGTEVVAKAPPDGYTLLLISAANAINATLYSKLSFDFIRDIAPVASISREPNVIVVHPSVPATTLTAFIDYAKANPGKVTMASGGNGAASHVSGELFKLVTGINMTHVPYRGAGPALTDLLGGQVQVYFAPMAATIEYIRPGRLRALAVTTTTRAVVLPDLPTVSEFVPGYEASQWYGIGAPRSTPAEIVGKLNTEVNAILADASFKTRIGELGQTPIPSSSAAFDRLVAEETAKWGKVVKLSGAKPD